jgi:hypothetical protein
MALHFEPVGEFKMTTTTSRFKSLGRAAAVAVVLGATSLAAVPAQAQPNSASGPNVQFGFNFNSPQGFGFSFGNGGFDGRHFNQHPRQRRCVADWQLMQMVEAQGFRNPIVVSASSWSYEVRARARGRHYTMDVNRCSGEITNIRAARGGWRR